VTRKEIILTRDDLFTVLQPTRRKIVEALKNGSMYIGQVAEAIGEDRKNVGFHLLVLEEKGIVRGEPGVIKEARSKGRLGKFYSLTKKGQKLLKVLKELEIK